MLRPSKVMVFDIYLMIQALFMEEKGLDFSHYFNVDSIKATRLTVV